MLVDASGVIRLRTPVPERLGQQPTATPPQDRVLSVVDSHTCGQPTRVIVSGAGIAAGTEPLTAQQELRDRHDWVRRMAVLEPRGHRSMFAAALIAPVSADGEFGVVYMDAYGYPNLCGHATIGVATTLFERGSIPIPTPRFCGPVELGLLTPAGRIALRARLDHGRVESVAFRPPIAFYLGSMLGADRRRIARKLGTGKFLVVAFVCEFSCYSPTYSRKRCPPPEASDFIRLRTQTPGRFRDGDWTRECLLRWVPKVS